jgi:hypothetical protein
VGSFLWGLPQNEVSTRAGQLHDPNYSDTTQKLLRHEANERHVFLFLGSLTPEGVTVLMVRPLKALPTVAPQMPLGITHLWALAPFGQGDLLMWNIDEGWRSFPVP